jgi:exodeoxyribonuclease VII large subunit
MYPSGHHYFTIKDETGAMKCVMFKSAAMRLRFRPENGMKVIAMGSVTVYVRDGVYQLYCTALVPEGVGDLHAAFEQLKAKLGAEGLFDPARKKPLPPHPKRVGVVTSPSGAAVHDIIRVARGRCPSAEILIFPSLVQGAEAPAYLRGGIQYFNAVKDDPEQGVDVIIIGRGGGSAEDLWGFNDERLARAIAASEIPVVSAVGHEVDFTICDFVADLRAATPSAAAELTLPDKGDLSRRVAALSTRLSGAQTTRLRRYRTRLTQLASAKVLTSPEGVYRLRRESLEGLSKRMTLSVNRHLTHKRQSLERVVAGLGALNPLGVLSRGYALVQSEEGKVIPAAAALEAGQTVTLRFSDGQAHAVIRDTATSNQEQEGSTHE